MSADAEPRFVWGRWERCQGCGSTAEPELVDGGRAGGKGDDVKGYTCAIWDIDEYGDVDYQLCETEQEAAAAGAWVEVYGDGSVLGLQCADGTAVPYDQWEALAAAVRKLREDEAARRRNASPPAQTRKVRDPFRSAEVDVEVTEPAWLGLPAGGAEQ